MGSVGHGKLGMIVYLHITRCTGYYVIFSHHVRLTRRVPLNPRIPLHIGIEMPIVFEDCILPVTGHMQMIMQHLFKVGAVQADPSLKATGFKI